MDTETTMVIITTTTIITMEEITITMVITTTPEITITMVAVTEIAMRDLMVDTTQIVIEAAIETEIDKTNVAAEEIVSSNQIIIHRVETSNSNNSSR